MSAVLADKGGPLQTCSMLHEPELLAVLLAASEPTLTLLLLQICGTLVPNCESKRQTGCGAQIVAKRPVSPHVFEIDGKGMHYKFPINATTSIMNRVTGTALTIGETCLCVGSTYSGFQAPEERQTSHVVTSSLTAGLVLQTTRVPCTATFRFAGCCIQRELCGKPRLHCTHFVSRV